MRQHAIQGRAPSHSGNPSARRARVAPPSRVLGAPMCEEFEPRMLLATFTVTNLNDAGAGSLRQAIADSNSAAGADVLEFQAGLTGTIPLTSGGLTVTDSLSINGPGANVLSVSGNNASGVFSVSGAANTSQISGLKMTAAAGSGLSISTGANVTVQRCEFSENNSAGSGGGIYAADSTLTITDSLIHNNQAAGGGGVFVINATMTMRNCTVADNHSENWGGGIGRWTNQPSTFVTISNSTITGNTCVNLGGGVYARHGVWTIVSSIISGNSNSVSSTPDDLASGGDGLSPTNAANSTNNLVGNAATSGNLVNGTGGNLVGVDPLLGALAANGGPTSTRALLPGSPAINAGANPASLTTDQRGTNFPRVRGSAVDIGAFEYTASPTLASFAATPGTLDAGQPLTLTATGPSDPDGTIAKVDFYLDSNANGTVDGGEWIAQDWDAAGGYTYVITATEFLPTGQIQFLAIAFDNNLNPSAIKTASATINQVVQAALIVTVAADENDNDPDPSDLSLREAILAANAGATGPITFDPGVTLITLTSALPAITVPLTITGPGAASLTISGANQFRIFTVDDGNNSAASAVSITGMTLTAASADTGAAILNRENLTVDGVVFNANTATVSGAGIEDNGTLTVRNSRFTGNNASAFGSAINLANANPATISSSAFSGNTSGGSTIDCAFLVATLTVDNCSFTQNTGTVGGAIFMGIALTVRQSTFFGNSAAAWGGAIAMYGGTLVVENSTIVGNHADTAGTGDAFGGGIEVGKDDAVGATDPGTVKLISTILSGNVEGAGAGTPNEMNFSRGATVAAGSINNLIKDAASAGGLTNGAAGNIVGVDPLLSATPVIAVNGTSFLAPQAGSPVLNKGSNPNSYTTDQRGTGFWRVVGSAADIGAVESGNTSVAHADQFIQQYTQAQKSAQGLVDGDWIAASLLQGGAPNVATSDAYWGARNHWFQDSGGNVWALWHGGPVHNSTTLAGQHEWVLTNLTDAGGLTGTMHLASGSLSGITTGWNAFSIQGIQDGVPWALWWSPQGSAGTYIDTDGSTKQGQALGLRGNGWSFNSIAAATTSIGGAVTTPPAAFRAYTESQGNGRTEFDPRSTRVIANTGMSIVMVDVNNHVYTLTFSVSQRSITGARPDLNAKWVLEPFAENPSLADLGLTAQTAAFEQDYIAAATQ